MREYKLIVQTLKLLSGAASLFLTAGWIKSAQKVIVLERKLHLISLPYGQ